MTDAATVRTFFRCQLCHGMTRADLAGDPARCASCGALVEAIATDPSSIVGRKVFRSGSLQRAEPLAGLVQRMQTADSNP